MISALDRPPGSPNSIVHLLQKVRGVGQGGVVHRSGKRLRHLRHVHVLTVTLEEVLGATDRPRSADGDCHLDRSDVRAFKDNRSVQIH